MKKILNNNNNNVLVALDIGTTKICILVAQSNHDKTLDIIALSSVPSLGMSKGVVIDIARVVASIKLAIKEVEITCGFKVKSVIVGISGSHIQSLNALGTIAIKKERVTNQDVINVLNSAKSALNINGQQILHILPQYFTIDSEHKVLDPIGMFGLRLEVKAHVIIGSLASFQNIIKCCELAGLSVSNMVLEQLASAYAVASEDEKILGSAILDIGGGTSDFAVYQNKAIRYTKVFSVAAKHITNDIALCLRATIKDAERVKCQYGSANLIENTNQEYKVELAQGNALKNVSIYEINSIIEPRVKELFLMLKKEIESQNLRPLMPAGLILTGGGALLKDIDRYACKILNMPVRIGMPNALDKKELLDSPIYSTAYGLLLYIIKEDTKKDDTQATSSFINRIVGRMRYWVADFF